MGTVSSSLRTAMVLISYDDSKTFFMEYTPYGLGGETIVTYNIGEVHLICSQFQGGYVAENSSREPNILYRLDLLA